MTANDVEQAVMAWHKAVNAADREAAVAVVSDPIVVNGPKGAGPIGPLEFLDWIDRSGIQLRARSHHPIADHVLVVEQDARWPQDTAWSRVATVFREHDGRISAALRFPTLRDALEFAYLYRELAATEAGGRAA